MKYLSFLILFLLLFVVTACENNKEDELNENKTQTGQESASKLNDQQKIEVMANFTPEQEIIKNKILKVLQDNLNATQNEDEEGVLETIHEDSPQLSSTKGGMEYVFKNFDMKYELEDVKFISISNEEVKAIYQQTTKAITGTGFTNTRSIGIHTLRKSKDGKWKIYSTEYVSAGPIK